MISGYPAWTRLWCVLRQHHLRCWAYPEDVGRQLPVKTVDLTKVRSVDKIDQEMDEWIDGWMDEWMNGCMDG